MKKSKNIILGLLLLMVLIGAYVYMNTKSNDKNTADTPNSEQQSLKLSDISKDKITKMSFSSNDGEVVLEKNGDKWRVAGEDIEIGQDRATNIASSFELLTATRVVEENPKEISKYGLDPAVVTAKVVMDDGSEKTFYLGNKTSEGTTYYFMVKDDSKVYLITSSAGNNFNFSIDDLRNKELAEINSDDLQYFYVKQQDKRTIEIARNEEKTEGQEYGLEVWKMKQPFSEVKAVNTENFRKLLEKLSAFKIKDFVEDQPKDLSKYGLDNPKMEIRIEDKENKLHLFVGSNKDDDSIYVKSGDKDAIYTMDASQLEPLDANPFDLIDKFVYLPSIDSIDKIDIEANGEKHHFVLTKTTKKVEKEDEQDKITISYKLEGKDVKEDIFKDYYQKLVGITFDAELDKAVEEEKPDVKTTFTLSDGKVVSIGYIPYNDDLYATNKNGVSEFLVSKRKVNSMLESLDKVVEETNK